MHVWLLQVVAKSRVALEHLIIFIWESIIIKVKSVIALSHVNMGVNQISSQEIGIELMYWIITSPLIIVNEKFCILIKMLLKFVLKGPIDIIPALV